MSHCKIQSMENDRAVITLHGVPYAEFDRTGHWSIWTIAKTLEAARLIPFYYGFLHFHEIQDDCYGLVVRKQVLRLNPKLHQTTCMFSKLMLKVDLQFLSLGKTSYSFAARLKDADTGELLAENFLKFVRINKKTRRAAEFPSFFQEKYGRIDGNEKVPFLDERNGSSDPPLDAYIYNVRVHRSDTDQNSHVNQSTYVKYCMDCATEAAMNKYYKNFDSDMCMYTTTKWEMDYIGESGAGDLLDVVTWQSNDDARIISFSIQLNKREIFRATSAFELHKQISPVKRYRNAKL
ncbi:hypothetical protein FSP39_020112 [Pinctada imbricata]|uniref:Acyl-ACP thioesterase-like C-terminal domain-containing protein n=1 Tax=Pinctada imbricata TaxID=66713 RepID=A0AA88XMC9_PINIB|nr:hypothetical protein FSP39_020112 [Pinctada imbricata]